MKTITEMTMEELQEQLFGDWSKDQHGRDVARMALRYGVDYDQSDPSLIEPTSEELSEYFAKNSIVRGYE